MIKVIIFDFDGVLVESLDIKTNAFARLFEAEGPEVVRRVVDYHLGHAGVSRFEKFRYYYATILKRELTDAVFDALCRRFASLVVDEVVGAPFVKGAREFLDRYASAYRCFVASATPQGEIDDIVRRRGMAHYFRGIYGAPKKKEEIVGEIMRVCGIAPSEAAYVGDALSDYNAALFHHTHFIARLSGKDDIFQGIDCRKVRDLTRLRAALDRIGCHGSG